MDLPTGTVTFLFTDLEGSTQLWERQPEAMRGALARHDELLHRAFESHGGKVFKTVGDAFCVAFQDAPEAVAAALEAQLALAGEDWGESGPLLGSPLNRAARLLAIAHGGQTLLSQAAYELVHDTLPKEVALRDLGAHRLKDLPLCKNTQVPAVSEHPSSRGGMKGGSACSLGLATTSWSWPGFG